MGLSHFVGLSEFVGFSYFVGGFFFLNHKAQGKVGSKGKNGEQREFLLKFYLKFYLKFCLVLIFIFLFISYFQIFVLSDLYVFFSLLHSRL